MKLSERWISTLVVVFIVIAAFVSKYLPWEMSGESWGYWYFAKQLVSGNGFVTPDRSPLYTVYLVPFLWLPPMVAVAVEGFVSTCICTLSVYYLLRWRLGHWLAGLFSILWIPFFQQMEPTNQVLGLACVCLAFGLRFNPGGKRSLRQRMSYILILAATLFRPNFIVYLPILFAYDVWVMRKEGGSLKAAVLETTKVFRQWLFIALVLMMVVFSAFQSVDKWNNVWLASTQWFPGNEKSLGATSVIGHFNWRYIELKYGSFEGKDFYFTHKEAFDGSTTVAGMIQANPWLFVKIVAMNIKGFLGVGSFNFAIPVMPVAHAQGLLQIFAFFALCFGAIKAATNKLVLAYVGGALAIVFITSLSYPKIRYMVPLVPIFGLSAWWYGTRLAIAAHVAHKPWLFKGVVVAVFFLFSLYPIMQWSQIFKPQVISGASQSTNEIAMNAAYPEIKKQAKGCNGIMSMEHLYFGAFIIDQPNVHNFDIWEIPPFGHYGASDYQGLNPDRVDCIFISSSLELTTGMATNNQIRYQSFIKPYAEYLTLLGAETHFIPGYGRVIKLNRVKSN